MALSGGQADRQTRGWGEALATASDDEVLHLLGLLPGILPWGEGLDPWRLSWMMDGRLGGRLLGRMGRTSCPTPTPLLVNQYCSFKIVWD